MDVIREATCDDLPEMAIAARSFAEAGRWYGKLDAVHFCLTWEALLESGAGAAWVLERDGTIAGGIGGIAYPDMFSADPVATEAFWFVQPEARGGGLKLFRAFEEWARARGCSRVRMAHLTNSMPGRLENVYKRMGFDQVETVWQKEIA